VEVAAAIKQPASETSTAWALGDRKGGLSGGKELEALFRAIPCVLGKSLSCFLTAISPFL
jgi:hypothetical protein